MSHLQIVQQGVHPLGKIRIYKSRRAGHFNRVISVTLQRACHRLSATVVDTQLHCCGAVGCRAGCNIKIKQMRVGILNGMRDGRCTVLARTTGYGQFSGFINLREKPRYRPDNLLSVDSSYVIAGKVVDNREYRSLLIDHSPQQQRHWGGRNYRLHNGDRIAYTLHSIKRCRVAHQAYIHPVVNHRENVTACVTHLFKTLSIGSSRA